MRYGTANFGITGVDWQQRINFDRMRTYRLERAREMMKKAGLGAMLCMYDENVRYLTGTLTPGWNRLKPGLRYALLCGDAQPVLFEQGDIGAQVERHAPWTLRKDPDKAGQLQDVCTVALNLFRQLAVYLSPVLPRMARQTGELLGVPIERWSDAAECALGLRHLLAIDGQESMYVDLLRQIEAGGLEHHGPK